MMVSVLIWGMFCLDGFQKFDDLYNPQAMSMTANEIYIADTDNQRVVVLDLNGRLVREVGRAGEGPGEFDKPTGLAVMPDGRLAVADAPRRRITFFKADGSYEKSINLQGHQVGFLVASPIGELWIGTSNGFTSYFATDDQQHRVFRYRESGELVAKYGSWSEKGKENPFLNAVFNQGFMGLRGDRLFFAARAENLIHIYGPTSQEMRYKIPFVPQEPTSSMDEVKNSDGSVSYTMRVSLDRICFGMVAFEDTLYLLRARGPEDEDDYAPRDLAILDHSGKLLASKTLPHGVRLMTSLNGRDLFVIRDMEDGWEVNHLVIEKDW